MSLRDKIKALQEEIAGLPGVKITIFTPTVASPAVSAKGSEAAAEKPDLNFDGDTEGDGGEKVFGVNALGLPTKIMKLLEEHGYETAAELQDAVDDGTFKDLKGVTNAIFTRVEKSLEEFKTNHPEAGGEDEDESGSADAEPDSSDDDAGSGDDESWKVGDRCQVRIDDSWYPGAVKKIDLDGEKMHILFDDGDKDWYPLDEVETLPDEE